MMLKDEKKIKMVVLDDDPTGIQTVHGCLLITQWDEESVRQGFDDQQPFFYILTNTRAMTREEAEAVTREAMEMVVRVNKNYGYRLIIVSRSDSCLRGHFPLETDVMRQVLLSHGKTVASKTPFCPAFIEAGRFTIDGVHYMKDGDRLIPVSETEFARDNVFAYHTSVLTDYIREKGANPDDYTIVNAQTYDELYAFADSVLSTLKSEVRSQEAGNRRQEAEDKSQEAGNRSQEAEDRRQEAEDKSQEAEVDAIVIRSSSSLPRALSGIPDIPFLDRSMLQHEGVGCFVVGSHVKKTTQQLECLLQAEGTCAIEVDVQRILDDADALMLETLDTIQQVVENYLTPVIYTSRQEIRLEDANQRQHLGQQVSDFLVDIVRRLPFTPAYLVGKGGITSHDILTKGLAIRTARVMGQIIASVPCVMTHEFPYIIFPGNVGNEQSLREVYMKLK